MPSRRKLFVACLVVAGVALAVISVQFRSYETQGADGHNSVTATPTAGAAQPSQNILPNRDHSDYPKPTSANPQTNALLEPIEAFRRWVETGDNADVATGLSLARTRRQALRQLIALDPQEALKHRLPFSQRAKLGPQIALLLEEVVDRFTTFEVIAICGREVAATDRFVSFGGRRYVTFTYGQRLRSLSQSRLPTHGIAVDDQLALSADPYRMPDPAETLAPGAVSGVQVYVGDALQTFSSPDELNSWGARQIAAELQLPSVFGAHTLLFLKIDFADAPGAMATDQAIVASMAEADRFHRAESANRTSFKTMILPAVLRSAKLKSFYNADPSSTLSLHDEATALARQYDAANGNLGIYNPDRYEYVAVLFAKITGYTTSISPNGWAGLADTPGKRLWLNGSADPGVIAHELGHNLGLRHGYAWKPGGNSPIQPGTHVEYGDPFDLMGASNSTNAGHFSVPKKRALDYITDANVQTVSATGQYRLYRHDARVGTNTVALKIDAGSAYDYWLEYRRDVPSDLSAYAAGVAHGVLIHWNKLPSFTQASAVGTYLLDMTPGSGGGMNDSALALGQSFYDPAYKIRLTPIRTGSSVQGDWIDVAVALGDYSTNRAPSVQSLVTDATAFARAPVNLSATGNDPDGDAVLYQWDMGDGNLVYTTGAKVSYQWAKGGVFPVAVRAYDVYGGETSQTFNVTVQDPLDAWNQVAVSGLTENLRAVCFGLGKFVTVGDYASASSADGKSWLKSTQGVSLFLGRAITASDNRFVAVGSTYSTLTGTFSTGIASSTDGITWAPVALTTNEELWDVAYGAGTFVAVGKSGRLLTSKNGVQWSSFQLVNQKNLWAVQFNGSLFLAVGDSGTAVVSVDGITWADRSLKDSNTISNGVTWFKDTDGSGVSVLNGKWRVISSWSYLDKTARILWSSTNATDWEIVKGTYFESDYVPIRLNAGAGSKVALAFPLQNAQPKFRFSSDGTVWTEKILGPASAGSLRGGAEGGGRIVLVGEKGQIFTSADGIPALAQQPQSQSVTVGQSASLQVVAYATGPFSFQWRKNGVSIAGATGSTLQLPATTFADAGDYTAAVTNARGITISSVASVNVVPTSVAPAISLQPVAQVVTAGGNVVLSVGASGYPPPAYQWQKAGVAIPGATNAALTFTSAQAGDAGSYSVIVANATGSVASNAVTLMVNVPPAVTAQSGNQTVTAGQTATLSVSATGTSPLTYQWRKNGVAVPGATAATLTINNAQAGDAGSYDVVATNLVSTATSAAAFLTVNVPPTITSQPSAQTVTAGLTASFTVVAGGTAPLTYQWRKDGTAIGGATTATYTVTNVSAGSAGSYSVTTSNAAGSITSTGATLTVNTPPLITTQPQSASLIAGQGASFTVVATAAPPPTYQWRKDGVAIPGATGATLTITNAQPSDAGSYSVAVTNAAGSVTSTTSTLAVLFCRLINLSILTSLDTSGDAFTMGYVVGGSGTSGTKPLVIRAAGPSLGAFGITGTLDDPKLELFAGATKAGENDNWGGSATVANAMSAVGAFAYTGPTSRDAAAAMSVARGDNSVKVSAAGTGTGTVIAEIYDATPAASFTGTTPRLVNVSVLKQLGPGFTVGFVVGGSGTRNILVRAIGPTLGTAFGVSGVVTDPQLILYSVQTAIAANDNWGGGSTLAAAFSSVAAFVLPTTSRDAAVVASLNPGNYTVQVSGVGGATGMILVEIYELP